MNELINMIKTNYGIDIKTISGVLTAAEEVERRNFSDTLIRSRINNIVDFEPPYIEDSNELKMTYKYLIQGLYKSRNQSNIELKEQFLKEQFLKEQFLEAHNNAVQFIKDHKWAFVDDVPNQSKLKSGPTKMDLAEKIFFTNTHLSKAEVQQMFIDELDMSLAGARTYYRTLKKKGTSEPPKQTRRIKVRKRRKS